MEISKTTVHIGLMRHAKTNWNLKKRIQGQKDEPLSPEGEAQAMVWCRELESTPWNRILASDLDRARRTAEIISTALQIPMTIDSRLKEQDWGEWTGKTVKQLREEDSQKLAEQEVTGWGFCPPGGEDRHSVWKRSHDALLEAAAKWPGSRILVIAHEGVIKSLIYRLYNRKFIPSETRILKKGYFLHRLFCDKMGLQVAKINALRLSDA